MFTQINIADSQLLKPQFLAPGTYLLGQSVQILPAPDCGIAIFWGTW
jgi:hypothetical protein